MDKVRWNTGGGPRPDSRVMYEEQLINSLRAGANISPRCCHSGAFVEALALHIGQALASIPDAEHAREVIESLIARHDYRLVADYLRARRAHDPEIVDVLERLTKATFPRETGRLRYRLSSAKLARGRPPATTGPVVFVPTLSGVLSQTEGAIAVYPVDPSWEVPVRLWVQDVGAEFGTFIEGQYDVPSRNALVRQGVVRSWYLPGGEAVVSKRENLQKPGRFLRELHAYEAIVGRLDGRLRLHLGRDADHHDLWLTVNRPIAVIGGGRSGRCYALHASLAGESLEELLLREEELAVRRRYLAHYRRRKSVV